MTKLLSKQDVMQGLDMQDTIEILRQAFIDLAGGEADLPQRTPITAPDYNGLALFMPAYLKGMGALGAKIVTIYKENPVWPSRTSPQPCMCTGKPRNWGWARISISNKGSVESGAAGAGFIFERLGV